MIEGLAAIAVDCDGDPVALAEWWRGLVGGEVAVDEDVDATLRAPGFPPLDFVRVPEGKAVKNRLHLDLRATDYAAAVAAALAHGAVPAPDVYGGDRWTVLRDPGGNEFCILRPRP
ncbi:MAG TPA: VOC family protein [Mycobacteriales bacterium]|nr:VOC family protein [Mycobacteriales bacterium]